MKKQQVPVQPATDVSQLGPYRAAFIRTVLNLRGVTDPPDLSDYVDALNTLRDFETAAQEGAERGENDEPEWPEDSPQGEFGKFDAFCFVTFGVVTMPDVV